MIRKLDRYMFFSFLVPFILCMVLILAMTLVVETSERLGKLLKYNGTDPLPGLLARYYLCRIPVMLYLMAPFITLAGAIVALVRLARSHELMAMQASGISMKRIGIPLLTGGFIAATLAACMQEVVVPRTARAMQRVSIKLIGSDETDRMQFKNVFAVDLKRPEFWVKDLDTASPLTLALRWDDETQTIMVGGPLQFEPQARRILTDHYRAQDIDRQFVGKQQDRFWLIANRKLTLEQFNAFAERLKTHYRLVRTQILVKADDYDYRKKAMHNATIDLPNFPPGIGPAESATILVDAGQWRRNGWYLTGRLLTAGQDEVTSEPLVDRHFYLTLSPEDLVPPDAKSGVSGLTYRSLRELQYFARQFPSRAASLNTEIQKRLVYPFINVILLLLAIPLVVESSGQTSARGIGLAAGMALGFYVVMLAMLDFGYRGYLWPSVAAWLPAAVFTAIGVWMYKHFHG